MRTLTGSIFCYDPSRKWENVRSSEAVCPLRYLSGVSEMALGLLLFVPRFSRLAAWGIIALLIAVFPANIYVYQNQAVLPALPLFHLLRLPLQGVFILWAYWHTKPTKEKSDDTKY